MSGWQSQAGVNHGSNSKFKKSDKDWASFWPFLKPILTLRDADFVQKQRLTKKLAQSLLQIWNCCSHGVTLFLFESLIHLIPFAAGGIIKAAYPAPFPGFRLVSPGGSIFRMRRFE